MSPIICALIFSVGIIHIWCLSSSSHLCLCAMFTWHFACYSTSRFSLHYHLRPAVSFSSVFAMTWRTAPAGRLAPQERDLMFTWAFQRPHCHLAPRWPPQSSFFHLLMCVHECVHVALMTHQSVVPVVMESTKGDSDLSFCLLCAFIWWIFSLSVFKHWLRRTHNKKWLTLSAVSSVGSPPLNRLAEKNKTEAPSFSVIDDGLGDGGCRLHPQDFPSQQLKAPYPSGTTYSSLCHWAVFLLHNWWVHITKRLILLVQHKAN